jgi:hypothetical protein
LRANAAAAFRIVSRPTPAGSPILNATKGAFDLVMVYSDVST